MKKSKNVLKIIGATSALSMPLISAISCAYTPSQDEMDLNSATIYNLVQQAWWTKVFTNQTSKKINKMKPMATIEIKNAFDFVIRKHFMKDNLHLMKKIDEISKTKAIQKIADAQGKTPSELIEKWNLDKMRINGDMTINPLTEECKNFLFNNIIDINKEVWKMTISTLFLKKEINKETYKNIFMKENQDYDGDYTKYDGKFKPFTDIQNLFKESDFNLINEAIDQHIFAKWDVNLSVKKTSDAHINTNWDDNKVSYDDALKQMKTSDSTKTMANWSEYTEKNSHLLKGLLPSALESEQKLTSFKGFMAESGSSDATGTIALDEDGLKQATNKNSWNGFLIDNKEKLVNDKEGISKNITLGYKNHAQLTLLKGFMPIYKNGKLSFEGTFFENDQDREKLVRILSQSNNLYAKAEKYYCNKKEPIKLKIAYKRWRDKLVEHGFKFIEK